MEEVAPLFIFNFLGYDIQITESLVVQWVIILITLILCIIYSKKVKKIPGKVQNVIEFGIDFIAKTVNENMGDGTSSFVPYIGALGLYLFVLNMIAMIGIEPPTSDFSVSLGIALTSFVVIQANTIKKRGIGGYLKGYVSPIPILLPINLMERIMLPISLTLRLFGNVFAASMIMKLVYDALLGINFVAAIGIPIPFHFYFDVFDGTIQMIIFVMLTMINIKITAEH
ncbi:MAG: F0F1 ATP synthase subunit A [Clostridium sp.]|nr:F0F1 ATP synthase subunit A [Clostridium sp.]